MYRPRLFYVLDSLEEDEVGEHVAVLLGRLSRARFEPRVVALGREGPLGPRLRRMKVTVHQLELSGPLGALLAIRRLRALLSGLHADILQTFQPWSGTVTQLAAPREATVFRSVQGFPPEPTTMGERFHAWLERRASLRRPRRFVVSDVGAVEWARARYHVDHVDVVPQCVDVAVLRDRAKAVAAREARVRLGMEEGQRALVLVSDFRDGGRMVQILEGFATARREDPALRLFVAGRGPDEGAARGRAEDLQLEDSVIFLGDTQDRAAMLRASEVLVEAGSWPGWSRCAVEAMAIGLPALRWVNGDDDPEAERYPARTTGPADRFARDMLALLENDQLRAEVARKSARNAQMYDVTSVADRWAEIYS